MLALLAACGGTPAPPALLGVAQSPDDAGTVDPALCAGLDECTCAATPGCVPLTTACWCPPAACGSTADCVCTGGRFLGCNPRGCPGQCALFADPSPRNERGCLGCVDPTDCATAVGRLPTVCPDSPAVDTAWLCDASYDPCAIYCINQLTTCAGASCALCANCTCGNDLFASCLYECLAARASGP